MAIGDNSYTVEINDSEFEREGWKRGRYKGTKLISAKINKFTAGDITFGKDPVIEQYSRTIYVFNQANPSFNTIAGIFYPTTDEFSQTLPDKQIIGSTNFKIDRAVTFTVGQPSNFSQTEPGNNETDPSFHYFDTLIKNDLALFNSCSVRFFDNANNGFIKSQYIIGYNRGEFKPAAAYFLDEEATATGVSASSGANNFIYNLNNDGRLYINPNVEDWFIAQDGASGSQGTIDGGNTAITINDMGGTTIINSVEGYFFGLSKRLLPKKDSYYISFDKGNQGTGIHNQKNIIKAFDIHELENSGSNFDDTNNKFNIKTTGRYGSTFTSTYDSDRSEEYILFREKTTNNNIHLDFNLPIEAPAGVGNGGVIIPNNLHPAIKESLNVYLGNAGLGAQGGATAQFGLGSSVQSVNTRASQQQATGRIGFQGADAEELTAGVSRQLSVAKQNISNLTSLSLQQTIALKDQSLAIETETTARNTLGDEIASLGTEIDEVSSAQSDFETGLGSTISKATSGFVTTAGLGETITKATSGFVTADDVSAQLKSYISDNTSTTTSTATEGQ